MRLADLPALLRNAAIPDSAYVLDGGLGAGECWGLERRDGIWLLYYSQRGRKSLRERLPTEALACQALIDALIRPLPIARETF